MITDPGQVPPFWVRVMIYDAGLLLRGLGEQEKTVLSDVQCFQTRAVPPLFGLQSLRAQHGPPLPLDQQLRRLLEQEVLHAPPLLHLRIHIFCGNDARIRLF